MSERPRIMKRPDFANMGEAVAWEKQHGQAPYEVPLVLPESVWRALPDALNEASYMLLRAARALDYLQEELSAGNRDPRLADVTELLAHGMRHIYERDGIFLEEIQDVLRQSLERHLPEEAA